MSHLCALKARLAALKRQVIEQQNKKSGGPGEGFEVRATGDARVGFIGFPSVGKSTLLTALTGVFSEAADYEFTTLTCVPGVMTHDGARIQILDLPGIIEGAKDGKGRGRQVIGCARTCDLILLVLDATKPVTHKILIEKELHGFGIRLNQRPPDIYFKKRERGGLNFQALVKQSVLNKDLVTTILREYKITHAEVSRQEMEIFASKLPHFLPISGALGWNIGVYQYILKDKIWEYMHLTRIYTKPKGDMPDFTQPVILRNYKISVKDFCRRIHKRLMDEFKHALVWGSSAKHVPQIVGRYVSPRRRMGHSSLAAGICWKMKM
eukprot:753895-Hanusia_phi.AAC.2